ncbi:alpha-hydroxy-acid oxidizing protein [Streptomyces sp. NPDC091287]|uniref:alpha-hydroxy-acid oxidizing protein n=1 Tax=Streptomyces sp. NPDC091287 TaxID=3365988 RepID=UPI003819B207
MHGHRSGLAWCAGCPPGATGWRLRARWPTGTAHPGCGTWTISRSAWQPEPCTTRCAITSTGPGSGSGSRTTTANTWPSASRPGCRAGQGGRGGGRLTTGHGSPSPVNQCLSLAEFAARARTVVSAPVWDFIEGRAGEEQTLAANVRAFERIRFRPRVLTGVSAGRARRAARPGRRPVPLRGF